MTKVECEVELCSWYSNGECTAEVIEITIEAANGAPVCQECHT